MFRFKREKILPVFLQRGITVAELTRLAGVSHQSAQRAMDGEKVAAPIINKIATALGINAVEYMEEGKPMQKELVVITRDDGTQKTFDVTVDYEKGVFATWFKNDADFHQVAQIMSKRFASRQKAEAK